MKEKLLKLLSTSKQKTSALIIATIFGIIGYDVIVATNDVKGDTISEIILKFTENNPSFAIAFGILCGHLFWSRNKDLSTKTDKLRKIGLITTAIAGIGADIFNVLPTNINPIIYLLGGVVFGKLFWSQKTKKG